MKHISLYCILFFIVLGGNFVHAFSVDPLSLSISSGETATLQLTGGSGYYSINSSDDTIATSFFAGDVVTVSGISKGVAIITIQDGNDTLTVSVNVDESISASSTTVYLLEGKSETITLTHGKPPFVVTATPMALAELNQNALTLTGTLKGTATVTVSDSVSDSVTIDVVVYSSLSTDADEIFLAENTTGTITISEGVPPYTAVSTDDSVATVSVSGNTLSVDGKAKGTASLVISDSAPTPNTIIVYADINTFNVSAKNLTIGEGNQIDFNILGTGFYNITVSDATILSAVISGNSVAVTGLLDGTATITISDSNGESIDVKAIVYSTISTSKSDLVLNDGTSEKLQIFGGVTPYSITSTTSGVVNVPSTWGVVPFNVMATGEGITLLTISDMAGNSTSVTVTVLNTGLGVGAKKIFVAPDSLETVMIFGGTGYYMVSSSNPSIAEAELGTDNVSVKAITTGKTVVTIQDSDKASTNMDVVVLLPAPKLDLSVNSKTVSIIWTIIQGADSYILYYAPPDPKGDPDLAKLGQVNLGNTTSLDVDLKTGDAFFVAVQAIDSSDPELSSLISTVVDFLIP